MESGLGERLLQRFGNNQSLVRRVVETFLQQLPAQMDALSQASAARDGVELGRIAHRLKGSASYFQVEPLARAATELEGQPADFQPALRELTRAVAGLELELRALLKSLG